jgi:hypothetical protein
MYVVARRCGTGEMEKDIPTGGHQQKKELNPNYYFCVFEVEVKRNIRLPGVNDSEEFLDKPTYDSAISGLEG